MAKQKPLYKLCRDVLRPLLSGMDSIFKSMLCVLLAGASMTSTGLVTRPSVQDCTSIRPLFLQSVEIKGVAVASRDNGRPVPGSHSINSQDPPFQFAGDIGTPLTDLVGCPVHLVDMIARAIEFAQPNRQPQIGVESSSFAINIRCAWARLGTEGRFPGSSERTWRTCALANGPGGHRLNDLTAHCQSRERSS